MTKSEYREFLEDICEDYCSSKKYCILKEFLVSAHPDSRTLAQIKCIDKLKFLLSKDKGEDVGWKTATEIWCDKGYAKAFADVYKEKDSVKIIFEKVIKIVEK